MHEIELKFEVPSSRRAALAAAVRRGKTAVQRLRALYFDTPDERLAGHRIALRLRKEGDAWVQTLKAGTGDSWRRLEHNVAVAHTAGADAPTLDLSRHDGTPAGKALGNALNGDEAQLAVRYETDVQRTTREIRFAGARVEMALDVGFIVAGHAKHELWELEFELKSGSVAGLFTLASRWAVSHGLWLNTVSKAERGTRLARGETWGPALKAETLALDPHTGTSPANVLRAVLRNCLEQVTVNASEIAAGSEVGAHVHQLRVGLRRLRTALREMSEFGDGIDPAWEPALREAFRALGEYRDRETVLAHFEPELEAAGAPPLAPPAPPDDAPTPQSTVRSSGFQATLLQLLRFSTSDTGDDPFASKKQVRAMFVKQLKRLHRQVVKDGARFETLQVEEQHRVRKRLKRLRYLSEFALPLFDADAVERYLSELRPAQDALGLHNDEGVAIQAYRERAVAEPAAWFAVGWLSAGLEEGVKRCRRALVRVGEAHRFWKG